MKFHTDDSLLLRRVVVILLVLIPCAGVASEPPSGLKYSKWSGALNVPDPVAISFDDAGRAYVTQTQRRKANDLDIRANRDWVPHDVGFRTVDDKLRFYHERLAPDRDQDRNRQRVQDLNGDGSHDYRDLMVLSERILRLEDTDGDGIADSLHQFADGFQTEVTGIAAGVLAHEGRVFATIAPDVWMLEDTDADGVADRRDIVASGFGLHIAYAGHDMHGLTVGPDGKIYWSIGDKGISVTDREGRRWSYPNQGGVMRCFPDGSEFEVFAHGLRNVQELAFDQYGNLFGVDNDADQPNERERFVYIVRGMDAGWRCHYQYRGDAWNPWTDERLWKTHHPGQAAYIIPPIRHSINGPAGFAFNPGTALSPAYRDYFFLTGAPNGQQIAFQVSPRGAAFDMVNVHEIGNGIPLVGINFGPDGALYGVDWGGGYPLNQTGAVWKIDDPEHSDSKIRIEVRDLLKSDFDQRSDQELAQFLSHPDQRVRLKAQFAMVREEYDGTLQSAAQNSANPLMSRVHAIWGLGQRARSDDSAVRTLTGLLQDSDPDILLQVIRTMGDLPHFDGMPLVPLLRHEDPRIRFHTLIALSSHPVNAAVDDMFSLAGEVAAEDIYMRHAVSLGLSTCAGPEELAHRQSHTDPRVRLISVLALRHQRSVEVAQFLEDTDVGVRSAAARAIHDDQSISDALPSLAKLVERSNVREPVILRRAINAGFLLGNSDSALRLLRFATRPDAPRHLRLEALDAVSNWMQPDPLDRVTGEPRNFNESARSLNQRQLKRDLNRLLSSSDAQIRAAAMAAYGSLKIPVDEAAVISIIIDSDSDDGLVLAAMNALQSQNSAALTDVLPTAASATSPEVVVRALELAVENEVEDVLKLLQSSLAPDRADIVRQRAVSLLPRLGSPEADQIILTQLKTAMPALSESVIALEILHAAEDRAEDHAEIKQEWLQLKSRLASAGEGSPGGEYEVCLSGGRPAVGRQLFNTHLQAQCVRCHRIGKQGSTVGPRLDDVGIKRNAEYLLRSIVDPGADIEDEYRSEVVVLASGLTILGVRIRESPEILVLADREGKEIEIEKDDIDERVVQKVSIMPDMKKVLSQFEIRDLVAYLKTLRKRPSP